MELTISSGAPPFYASPVFPTSIATRDISSKCERMDYTNWFSFAPMFKALSHMQPNISLASVDLVTDRHSLVQLLSYIQSGSQPDLDNWRIHVELINNTMFFTRWEPNPRTMPNEIRALHHRKGLDRAFTSHGPGLNNSLKNCQIVSYEMGGLDCMVILRLTHI